MRIYCSKCGASVSSEVPDNTVIRAWVECPECIEKKSEKVEGSRDKIAEMYDEIESTVMLHQSMPIKNYKEVKEKMVERFSQEILAIPEILNGLILLSEKLSDTVEWGKEEGW